MHNHAGWNENGRAEVEGKHKIDGVPGTGAKIVLDWADSDPEVGMPAGHVLASKLIHEGNF